MNKFKKSQVLVLFVLVFLLAITPFLPSSVRPTYLYFILNFLIITLGAEAGLLSVFSRPLEDSKQFASVIQKPVIPPEVNFEKREASSTRSVCAVSEHVEEKLKAVEKSAISERVVCGTKVDKVQADEEVMDEEVEAEEEIDGVSGQELFAKDEAFIRNFYKQLKMQREESLIYQKAF
ncbi:uncharacterized protein LOC133288014 [Gastrolobium bilobum]|uniref:uncharacterized protein LOC133288014 n=1 Tax=Gastrolobium bilobum TaxID=150636 RepID=UPI002AB1AE7D|nr:uncharacterized protein LOC133288014 [Gastrolobium bilobum]